MGGQQSTHPAEAETSPPPQRYALVLSGAIVNTIVWDGATPYSPPPGCALLPEAEALAQGLRPAARPGVSIRGRRKAAPRDAAPGAAPRQEG